MPRLLRAMHEDVCRATADMLLSCLHTGQRRANVQAMAWEQLDLARGLWRIPRTKTGGEHLVPLVKRSLQLLSAREGEAPGELVFPYSRSASGRVEAPWAAWRQIRTWAPAGCPFCGAETEKGGSMKAPPSRRAASG